ncbi:MAG: potassium transporter TrkA [Oscillochloris sp.]|nr:potassium transporter TrkA [Oscillochloris sp.]
MISRFRRRTRPTPSADDIRLERLRRRRRRYPIGRLISANLRDLIQLLRQSWFSLASLALVLVGGVAYLSLVDQPRRCPACSPDFALALYDTLQLLIFQSSLDFPNDLPGRVLFFAIPLLGLFFLLQSVVDFARLLVNKSARRESWQISLAATFRDHVIVCGLGRVGYRVVLQLLDAGYAVVAIDNDFSSEFVPAVMDLKVPVIFGDARDSAIQRQAGLARARGIIAAIDDDLKNIEIALNARRRRPEITTVLRIYNRALDVNLERRFGRNSAFSSSAIAAPTFAAAAVSRSVVHVLDMPEGLIGIAEITIAAESELSGFVSSVEERFATRILRRYDSSGRERGQAFMSRLEAGDRALFLGSLDALEQLRLQNRAGSKISFLSAARAHAPETPPGPIILCGLGKVGDRVTQLLIALEPRPELVVICTAETPQAQIDNLRDRGVHVICGDACDPAILRQAGISDAHALAALFSDDLLNLQIGLAAREIDADVHLVLRVFSDVLAERLATLFGINTAYSTSALAAPTLAAAAVRPEVDHAFDVNGQLFATLTLHAADGDELAGKRVSALRTQGLIVVTLRRVGGRRTLPNPDERIIPGDEIVVLGTLSALDTVRKA